MPRLLRNVLAVLAGLILGSLVNMALVTIGPRVIAPAADAGAPFSEPRHLLFPFLAHAVGTLVGALVAHLIGAGPRTALAYVIGGFFLAGGIAAAFMIPAPGWFIAVDLLGAYLPMAWLAARVGSRLRPTAPIAHVR